MTANADAVAQPIFLKDLRFAGTGLTVGQRLTILEEASGSVVADHFIEAATEDVSLLPNCRWVKGLVITAFPASGGQVLVVNG
jgi:hypothetical protein